MSERGIEFDAKREAYETARQEQAELIDQPVKDVPVCDYIEQLAKARRKVARAHKAMLAAWQ